MAFIHVINGGPDPQLFEHAQSADAQRNFLAHAVVEIAAIKLGGDRAVDRIRILRDVAIEQIELHPPDVDSPDFEKHLRAGEHHADQHFALVGALDRSHRQRIKIVDRRALLLPSVGTYGLAEVSVLIEESDAGEREIRIARGFQMIAGEYTQAA